MKLSVRAENGTRLLLDLALHREEESVLVKDIAYRQEVSLGYLRQLIRPLIATGMVRSFRGPRGGICLAKEPKEVRLSEVIQILEGSMALVECVDNAEVCKRVDICVTRDIWCDLKQAIDQVLHATTLQDLVERHREKEHPEGMMYYI